MTVHPDQNIAYVVSMTQSGNTPALLGGEEPYIYTIDLTTFPLPTVVSSTPLRALPGGPPPSSMANFRPSSGHCPFVRNPDLVGDATDRLYIPSITNPNDGVDDGSVLVLDVTAPFETDPQFLDHIIISDPSGSNKPHWNLFDLVAAPVNPDFLGPATMDRNVLFGIMLDQSPDPDGRYGKLLILQDR